MPSPGPWSCTSESCRSRSSPMSFTPTLQAASVSDGWTELAVRAAVERGNAFRMCKMPLLLCSPVWQCCQRELHAELAAVAAWTQPGHIPLPLGPPEEVGASKHTYFTSLCASFNDVQLVSLLCAVLTLVTTGGRHSAATTKCLLTKQIC